MLQFKTADYCQQNNRKLTGTIDPKVILKWKDVTIGSPQVSQSMVPSNTPPYPSNRKSKGEKLQQYIVENKGFDWRLYASPVVGRLPNGDLYIIDGEHRFNLANIFLQNMKMLPVVIVDFDDETQMANAFWKKNGGFITKVTNETQLISAYFGNTPYAKALGNILDNINVVVAEDIDNFIPPKVNTKWKIKVRSLEAIKKISKDLDAIKKAVSLYKKAFPKLTLKSGNVFIEITGQLIQALTFIFSFEPYVQWHKNNPDAFANWFIGLVERKQTPKKHLYEVEYPHERMEQRYLGTAYGLIQDCFADLRMTEKNVPSPDPMEIAYKQHAVTKAKKRKAA